MASEWTIQTFADLISSGLLLLSDGYRAKNEELGGSGPIFLRAGHVSDSHIDFAGVERFHERISPTLINKMAHPGDVVVTTKGNSTGRVTYVSIRMPSFVYSPHLSFWRSLDPKSLVPGYLRYWSRGREFREQLAGLAGSTDMAPYLSLIDQRRLRITLPAPSIQRAIAQILGSLDDKIELNRRMNETLEAMARALFKSWFIDFDPVRARADGRKPEGMDEATAKLFPDSFEESELGPIPKGWQTLPFLELADLLSGGTPATSNPAYWDGPIPWASAKDVSQCGQLFLIDTDRSISEQGLSNSSTKIIPKHSTVVVARGATTGRFTMFGSDIAMNQTCYGLRSRDSLPFYLNCCFFELVNELVHSAHGSVFDTITTDTFRRGVVVAPSLELRNQFEQTVNHLFQQVLANLLETRTLAATRDALLPKLLSGELRIEDAERFVEAAP